MFKQKLSHEESMAGIEEVSCGLHTDTADSDIKNCTGREQNISCLKKSFTGTSLNENCASPIGRKEASTTRLPEEDDTGRLCKMDDENSLVGGRTEGTTAQSWLQLYLKS